MRVIHPWEDRHLAQEIARTRELVGRALDAEDRVALRGQMMYLMGLRTAAVMLDHPDARPAAQRRWWTPWRRR